MIRSRILYTNVPYFAVIEGQHSSPQAKCFPSGIEIVDTFRFETMGKKVLGQVLTIKSKTADIDCLLTSWGYQVEASETLTLLWPPAAQINEVSTINSDYAFLFSSFNLEPHGNINVHSGDIKRVDTGLSRVSVNSRVKVFRKNAEIIIDEVKEPPTNYDVPPFSKSHAYIYKVPNDGAYFLFNRSGVVPISEGQSVALTPGSLIKHYHLGYLDSIIESIEPHELSGERLLNDLLAHYKRTERFLGDVFDPLELSDTAAQYVAKCNESGVINSAAKRFIEEGQL